MLIYNSKKEFLGIDEADLKSLGFNNLAELQAESTNFEDLFLRTPGFIHNFKYVHWIDYILYGNNKELPKAILHTQNQDFMCSLKISTTYMSDSPSSKAYIVYLENMRKLSQTESRDLANDIADKKAPASISIENSPIEEKIDINLIKKSIVQENSLLFDTQTAENLNDKIEIEDIEEPLEIEDTPLEVEDVLVSEVEPQEIVEEKIENSESTQNKIEVETETDEVQIEETSQHSEEEYESSYVYNPQVASDELGLPIDLIEEFIEDFIAQAKEFKEELYKSVEEEDVNNLRILSHKLKGVAANLRIEDALEVLTTANTSDDLNVVKQNLDYLYIIIKKLDTEETQEDIIAETLTVKEEITNSEDEFILDFKDENSEVVSSDSGYDKVQVAQEIGIDIDTFNDLFHDYIIDAQEILDNMEQLVKSNDLIHLKKYIVKLQGMNRNMRIENLSTDLQTLIDTPNQDVAAEAISKINSVISSMKA